jgi:hypothetical protein
MLLIGSVAHTSSQKFVYAYSVAIKKAGMDVQLHNTDRAVAHRSRRRGRGVVGGGRRESAAAAVHPMGRVLPRVLDLQVDA